MSAVALQSPPRQGPSVALGDIEFATFRVGSLLLGIDIRQTEEINRQLELTPVPHAPACVRGVVNLRGEVVTVLDLRIILGLEPLTLNQSSRNVVVRNDAEQVGLLVDRVADVVTVRAEEMELPPANVNGVSGKFFKGVYKLDSALLVALDVHTVLSTAGKEEAN